MIERSTQPIVETVGIVEIADITEIASSKLQIRRRRDHSIALLMQRSGAKFIVLLDTIWKSANFSGMQKDATTSTGGQGTSSRQTSPSRS
jgi:hypothetical protein